VAKLSKNTFIFYFKSKKSKTLKKELKPKKYQVKIYLFALFL